MRVFTFTTTCRQSLAVAWILARILPSPTIFLVQHPDAEAAIGASLPVWPRTIVDCDIGEDLAEQVLPPLVQGVHILTGAGDANIRAFVASWRRTRHVVCLGYAHVDGIGASVTTDLRFGAASRRYTPDVGVDACIGARVGIPRRNQIEPQVRAMLEDLDAIA
ncbi:MAG: hypothetical protein RL410_1599 [Actinomycetota bacterium]|jgi:hypothetical protein